MQNACPVRAARVGGPNRFALALLSWRIHTLCMYNLFCHQSLGGIQYLSAIHSMAGKI